MEWSELGKTIAAVVGAGGLAGIVGAVGGYLLNRRRMDGSFSLKERQQIFAEYQKLVTDLRTDVGELQANVSGLHAAHVDCERRFAQLHREHTALADKVNGTRPS